MLRGLRRYFICEFCGQASATLLLWLSSAVIFTLFGASECTFKNITTM